MKINAGNEYRFKLEEFESDDAYTNYKFTMIINGYEFAQTFSYSQWLDREGILLMWHDLISGIHQKIVKSCYMDDKIPRKINERRNKR